MRIEVENLTEAGQSVEHRYEPGQLDLDEDVAHLASSAEVSGRASRKGEVVRLRGRIRAGLEVACDRCLAPLPVPVEVEFDTSFIPQAEAAGAAENVELQAEDLGLDAYEGDAIDLDALVREQLLLALPMRHLCRDDCKGLCPTCGADLNAGQCSCEQKEIDPRWAGLADWKKGSE